MKYKKLQRVIANLEHIVGGTIELPTKADWKKLTNNEQESVLRELINEAFSIAASVACALTEEDDTVQPSNETEAPTSNSINSILAERGSNYGEFPNHADLSQTLKSTFDTHVRTHGKPELFTNTMNEAIEMIFHKLARIGNGSPVYIENWRDIIGYTQLVISDLETTDGTTDARVIKMQKQHGEWVDIP